MVKKLVLIGGVVLAVALLALGGLAYLAFSNLDEIVRKGAEVGLNASLNATSTVEGASVDLKGQSVELKGITIGNPPGYESDHAVKLARVKVTIDAASFKTEKPIIQLVEIVQPDIIMETKGKTTNLQALMKSAEEEQEQQEADPNQKQFVIRRLSIEKPKVQVAIPLSGGRTAGVTLPSVEKENIGEGEPVTTAEALEEFFGLVLATVQSGSRQLAAEVGKLGGEAAAAFSDATGDLGALASETTAAAKQAVSGAADSAKEAADEAVGTAKDAAKGVGDAVGGLLGRKKHDK